MANEKPKTEEIENAVETLVAAGVPPAALRDRLGALESANTSAPPLPEPEESGLNRRTRRALRRGREPKRKVNPNEEAIKILTRAGLDPDALRGELRAAQATAIPFGQEPPPIVIPPFDTDKIQALPEVNFEVGAVDQAIATLIVEGIDPGEADGLVKNRAEEVQTKAEEIGRRVYTDISHQGEIHPRLAKATADMRIWLLAEMIG